MFELGDNQLHNATIKVVGIGGSGGNAEHMMTEHIDGVNLFVQIQMRKHWKISARTVLHLGEE
jgi:cell division GTPase FtsZ